MSDTRVLLGKIAALRQRLEQAQGLAREADSAAAGLLTERARRLDLATAAGGEHDSGLDQVVRAVIGPVATSSAIPHQLTARARRVLERGRELLSQLRPLADAFAPEGEDSEGSPLPADPLSRLVRETTAIADTALRTVPLLPDSTAAQLHLCEGLEATLNIVSGRVQVLNAALARRAAEWDQVARLAALLTDLDKGEPVTPDPFAALADEVLAEARTGAPLRFASWEDDPARAVAAHSLTVARVLARVVRYDPDLRHRSRECVLAALLHDAGMLRVPSDLLRHPGPLEDEQRRLIETHCRHGAEMAAALAPEAGWLAEAAANHHERLDGTGYPYGLREAQLTPLPRLLAVCDVYASLCVARPYRPARETRTALTDTLLLAEQGKLDGHQAERLLQLSFYPVGSAVELADGTVGVVVATPVSRKEMLSPARPVIALLLDPQGQAFPCPRHIDLAQTDDHSVVRALSADERRELLGARFPEWV
jgi:HD-GYP domain-containing protein (c-di-GMP phosphodiesterase class II)